MHPWHITSDACEIRLRKRVIGLCFLSPIIICLHLYNIYKHISTIVCHIDNEKYDDRNAIFQSLLILHSAIPGRTFECVRADKGVEPSEGE
jgi:hypothetical protein